MALTFPRLVRRPRSRALHYEGVLGTSLELQFRTTGERHVGPLEQAVLDEIDRLEQVFSSYRPTSEFSCWMGAEPGDRAVSAELCDVLAASLDWWRITRGAFHPCAEALSRHWRSAEAEGVDTPAELASIVTEMAGPPWVVDRRAGSARRITRLPATLNAIAKGYIIDRICAMAAETAGIEEPLINLGGDLRHIGSATVEVAIADPFAPADNAEPLTRVRLRNQGLATSGPYHRGFRLRDRWYSHVLDPRTGMPAEAIVSASVIAPDAMTADVLATAFSILQPQESLELAAQLTGVGCLLVTRGGELIQSARWGHVPESISTTSSSSSSPKSP